MMKSIFEEATRVWVWLGPGNGQSAEVIAKFPELLEAGMEICSTISPQWFANRPRVMSWLSSDDTWSTFYDLVNNSWYSRLWVFQEAAFARELRVLLGSHEVEWNVLERVIQRALFWDFVGADGKRPERPAVRTGTIFNTRKIIRRLVALGKPVTGEDAVAIINCTQGADCLEPRDRVFATLGFFAFQVEENASLEDMYSQLALFMLSILPPASRYWWMLLRSARSANKRQGLPSWCPDFHDVEGQDHWSLNCQDHSASRRAGTFDVTYDPQSKKIFLEGQIIDTIRTVLPEFPDTSGMMRADQSIAFHGWQSSLETIIFADRPSRPGQARIYSDRNEVAEALWKTLKAGLAFAEFPYETLTQFKEDSCVILHNLETIDSIKADSLYEVYTNLEQLPGLFNHLMTTCLLICIAKERRIFVSSEGRICLGPSNIRQGDHVCIFSFAMTAHIIRQTPNAGDKTYNLIGESYVHGMMNGEVEELNIDEENIILV
ncbi:hypothetical protein BJ166DRAFT_246115 [Pestalotiopsis sp. NC0098]|nr:hypothetical protein BJ166DRAFT_246115 [Pestalotiopsis sp. NC0098]